MRPPRLLALRALGLGDLLTAVPALRGLRRLTPAHEILLAAPAPLAPLMAFSGAVDRVIAAAGLTALPIVRPAIAVDLHGWGLRSQQILRDTRPGRLVAFGGIAGGVAGPTYDQDEHEVHRWCRLVSEALDAPADPSDLRLPEPPLPSSVTDAIVVHPGAAFPARRWGATRYGRVAAALRTNGRVFITGSKAECALAHQVARVAGLPPGAVLAGRLSVVELAGLVAKARLVVCGDTGIAHLASAYGTASVVLFGPVSPARWGPPPCGPHRVIWHGDGQGNPWGRQIDPALDRITVQEVLEAIGQVREELP